MSTNTPNFGIVLPEGTDTFNPLTFNNTAFTRVDEVMKNNQDRGVTPATHIYLDGVNTISRNIATCNLMVFTATSDYEKGSIIAVDGVTCTFRYADGTAPESNAFRTNQSVICYLNGTILTMVSAGSGEAIIGKLSELTTTNKDTIVSAVNELNTDLSQLVKSKTERVTTETNGVIFLDLPSTKKLICLDATNNVLCFPYVFNGYWRVMLSGVSQFPSKLDQGITFDITYYYLD